MVWEDQLAASRDLVSCLLYGFSKINFCFNNFTFTFSFLLNLDF